MAEVFLWAVAAWFGWIAAPFIFFFGLFAAVFLIALCVAMVGRFAAGVRRVLPRFKVSNGRRP